MQNVTGNAKKTFRKMRHLLFIVIILWTNAVIGQPSIDLNEIKQVTNDSTSEFFYDTLLSEFNSEPENITDIKAKLLY